MKLCILYSPEKKRGEIWWSCVYYTHPKKRRKFFGHFWSYATLGALYSLHSLAISVFIFFPIYASLYISVGKTIYTHRDAQSVDIYMYPGLSTDKNKCHGWTTRKMKGQIWFSNINGSIGRGGGGDSFESEVISYYLKSLLHLEREVINPDYSILVAWWCWVKAIECRKAMQALRGWRLVGSLFGRTFEFIKIENGTGFSRSFYYAMPRVFLIGRDYKSLWFEIA
jgi:hypothetical protein